MGVGRHRVRAHRRPGNHRNWLIDLRRDKGLTQAEVAARLGISAQYYAKLETETRIGRPWVLMKISDFYGVPLRWLAGDGPSEEERAE